MPTRGGPVPPTSQQGAVQRIPKPRRKRRKLIKVLLCFGERRSAVVAPQVPSAMEEMAANEPDPPRGEPERAEDLEEETSMETDQSPEPEQQLGEWTFVCVCVCVCVCVLHVAVCSRVRQLWCASIICLAAYVV